MRAKNIIIVLILIGIIVVSSILIFTKATELASIIGSKTSSVSLEQETLNNELLPEEIALLEEEIKEPAKDIPDKYKEYIEDVDIIINVANRFLEEKTQFTDIIKSIDEQGINIVADDVSFSIEFDENGLIEDMLLEVKDEYDTIVINKDLNVFIESALSAKKASDYMGLVSDVDIPLKYYLKVPKVIDFILEHGL